MPAPYAAVLKVGHYRHKSVFNNALKPQKRIPPRITTAVIGHFTLTILGRFAQRSPSTGALCPIGEPQAGRGWHVQAWLGRGPITANGRPLTVAHQAARISGVWVTWQSSGGVIRVLFQQEGYYCGAGFQPSVGGQACQFISSLERLLHISGGLLDH